MTALGVILAGGAARRMGGGDKGLLLLGGRPLLAHVIGRLRPQVAALALNANGDPARFAGFALPVIPDPEDVAPLSGPLAGVLAGLDHAAKLGLPRIVTAAWDTPFLPPDLAARLAEAAAAAGTPVAVAATPDPERGTARHPTFALWSVALRAPLRAALAEGVRKVMAFAAPQGCAEAPFPAGPPDPFFNVNRPEDLIEAERLLAEAPCG